MLGCVSIILRVGENPEGRGSRLLLGEWVIEKDVGLRFLIF
jgi:hypothetical protein